ncbi:hypothetical protein B0A50_02607 [Salinomyces thailandicus]|uniref:Uncharacterized protein n=1 Tax=Salinomyces thailandicus TaxID=706561 RepID=A0A4U0U5F7_9PEZI|nr:hypothetical protein B0A50_02607 [Salinomyces thailandica]
MGTSSSQPVPQTQIAEPPISPTPSDKSQPPSPAVNHARMHGVEEAHDIAREHDDDCGSGSGSEVLVPHCVPLRRDTDCKEIAVASPRSKVAARTTPPDTGMARTHVSPVEKQMVALHSSEDVTSEPKMKKRKRKGSEGQAGRGRPRDPSQLKRRAAAEPVTEHVEDKACTADEHAGSARGVAKKRKLSKADRHAQEIANGLVDTTHGLEANGDGQLDAHQRVEQRRTSRRSMKSKESEAKAIIQAVRGDDIATNANEAQDTDDAERDAHKPQSGTAGKKGTKKASRVDEAADHGDGSEHHLEKPSLSAPKSQRQGRSGQGSTTVEDSKINAATARLDPSPVRSKRRRRRSPAKELSQAVPQIRTEVEEVPQQVAYGDLTLTELGVPGAQPEAKEDQDCGKTGLQESPARARAPGRPNERLAGRRTSAIDCAGPEHTPPPADDSTAANASDRRVTADHKLAPTQMSCVSGKKRAMLPAPVSYGPISGPFEGSEKAAADAVFEYVCQQHGIASAQLKQNLTVWKTVPELKLEMAAALPNRKPTAIRKFCQRRFTLEESGPWTKEQDEALRMAKVEHQNQWVEIGKIVGRTGASCRDRWRDHLQHANYETGPWSQEEEHALSAAVDQCVELVRLQALADNNPELAQDRDMLENFINWDKVAGLMHGKRGQKRCREKWRMIKSRGTATSSVVEVEPLSPSKTAPALNAQSRKQRGAQRKLNSFCYGDWYQILVEICTAIPDHTKQYRDESTVWSIISQKNKDSRYKRTVRRAAYYKALESYATGNKVKEAQTIAGKARAMAKSMKKWAKQNAIDLRIQNTEPAAEESPSEARGEVGSGSRAKRRKSAAQSTKTKAFKSEEHVVESEEEVETS